jgi:hypothetical protein
MLEFTHNNQPHADQIHTSFELMNGKAPIAIPTTFKNTKFSSVAKKIKNLVTSMEEALAAHELARSRMVERIKSNFVPVKWSGWTRDISRQIIIRRWVQNERDHSRLKKCWDR